MQAPVIHILPLATIRRERRLSYPGRVITHPGQTVGAGDVIAETSFAREHALLDVAASLGISAAAADKLIECKIGDRLTQGSVLAEGGGLFPRAVRVPRDGRVVAVGGGQVMMEVNITNQELKAGLPGTVIEVIEGRGAIIQGRGALVQGVWGNGRMDTGVMLSLMDKPEEVLTAAKLDVSLRGSIILGGYCRDAEALKAAAELPLRGLILSSISPAILPVAVQMRYPIVVTDGIGAQAMNPLAYKLLSTNAKREATLLAEGFDRYAGTRPEIFIPLPISQDSPLPEDLAAFAPGQQVLLRRAPHVGSLATIVGLRKGMVQVDSGLRTPAADVRLENGEQVLVPLANLEVVG
jgi:hypothetical protein